MEQSLLTVLFLGFLLGIKHAIEPDHVIAVSTIASQSKKLWRSTLAGIFWGIGHTATLLVMGLIMIVMKGEIPDVWAMSLEFLVGVMLVYLGVSSVLAFRKRKMHAHVHAHRETVHNHFHSHEFTSSHEHEHCDVSYLRSVLIGFIHGLAGSAAMVLLTMSTVSSVWESCLYILVFGAGTIIGMLLFTTAIGIPFVMSASNLTLNRLLTQVTGWVSTAFGLYYMYNLGVTEGLFQLWFS
ncbi:sulfite exporter TauE/SafE family protein [Brevibacillus sp. H7]|uniref:HoxN/HupN/NixA family nickel/cobalt transporter n=1 Tax=Brevibacillus sp. H7 TaxID=3349138 RepID=UPI003822BCC0